MVNYDNLSDEELVILSNNGDSQSTEMLLIRYKPLVRQIARSYYIAGAEHGDIIQEGMIGLFKAIRDYVLDRNTLFKSFANLCVKRQIIDALKSATRNKHMPLNNSLSLDTPAMAEVITSYDNPETTLLENEEHKELRHNINSVLSKYEIKILNLYLLKRSYQEIAVEVGKDSKSIDNAMQRIKKKIRELI